MKHALVLHGPKVCLSKQRGFAKISSTGFLSYGKSPGYRIERKQDGGLPSSNFRYTALLKDILRFQY